MFGESLDRTKDYTDRRFDKKPRIKTNMENGQRYLDKAKFLSKFSCFDGYMQYLDCRWNETCQGINYEDFKDSLEQELALYNSQRANTNFYNNYMTEELIVKKLDCGGNL